ncbi:Protein of unknown function [Gryllus bimaculatus]|nr:Protein of unknown function [Gryllus bimaculatus]
MSEYVITSTVSGTRYCSTISAMLQIPPGFCLRKCTLKVVGVQSPLRRFQVLNSTFCRRQILTWAAPMVAHASDTPPNSPPTGRVTHMA